ncbi:DUF6252 family protein [Emticicia oligotrophica]|uniref:DUF6252 family protein n=1 Tax=Emticicia oligotrophica TaxID=312279 RepID=UPI00273CCD05|nr:DUF6252 family protein [Emticicia oligotrophica]
MKVKFLIIVTILAFFISCDKDSVDAKSLFFRVKVDGKLVEATGINAYAVQDDDEYNIYGIFSSKSSIYIQLAKDKGVGTHQITENPNFALYADETETGHRSDRTGATGEVTITEKTAEVVKGTFKCTVKQANNSTKVYTLTEGEFSVKFR